MKLKQIEASCNAAWKLVAKPKMAKGLTKAQKKSFKQDLNKAKTDFTKKCHVVGVQENVMKTPVGKPCFIQTIGDKFIPNPKKGGEEFLAHPKLVTAACLLARSLEERWVAFKDATAAKPSDTPKAVGLSADATPSDGKAVALPADATPADGKAVALPADATPADGKAVALPADATPADGKAVALPADATPADGKSVALPADATPVDAPKVVGLPSDATPSVLKTVEPSMLTLKNRLSAMVGVFFNTTPTGLSVNDSEPKIPYTIGGFVWGRAGGLITPATMSEHWAYTTFVGVQAEGMSFDAQRAAVPYNNKFNVWGVGPAVSGQFVYEPTKDGARLIFGPDVAFLVGALSTKGLIDVGIPERLYEAPKPRAVGTALAGLSVGMETPAMKGGPSMTILLGTGLRWFFHGDQVTDTPAGYEGAIVRLKSGPTFDFVKLSIGINY